MKWELMQHSANMIFSFVILYKPSISGRNVTWFAKGHGKVNADTGVELFWRFLLLCQSKAYCAQGHVVTWGGVLLTYVSQNVTGQQHSQHVVSKENVPIGSSIEYRVFSLQVPMWFFFSSLRNDQMWRTESDHQTHRRLIIKWLSILFLSNWQ